MQRINKYLQLHFSAMADLYNTLRVKGAVSQMGKTEADRNGLKLEFSKTVHVQPNSFLKLISAVCIFKK